MRLTDREEPKHKLDRGDDFKLVMVLGERVRQRPALRRRARRLGESRVPLEGEVTRWANPRTGRQGREDRHAIEHHIRR
jgi:hypothetical protein